MLLIRSSVLLVTLAVWGCGKEAVTPGKPTALTIVASFPESESSEEQLSLTSADAVTPTATSTATPTAAVTPIARETSTSTLKSIPSRLLSLGEDLEGAEKVFTHKGAFRWFSYKILNGAILLKSDSIEIDDPSVSELRPIEVSARVGDQLSLKLSFMQVDFLSEPDAKGFCDNGSIGFVRTWDASSEQTVDDSGVISLNFEESGRTAVTMAAVKIGQDQLTTKSPETLKSTLLNEHTGFRLSEGVCPIKNLYPNFDSTDRFLKVMTFLRPLKPMQLIHFNDDEKFPSLTEAGGWKAFVKGLTQPDTQRELGVSSAFEVESNDTGWNLVPASFTDVLPKALNPRLPLSTVKPETEHATRPTLTGQHLRYNTSGALMEKVKVEVLTLRDASLACDAGIPIATYTDHQEDAVTIPTLLGQGAGTYMLRIRTTFADKTLVCSTTPLKIDVPAFIPDVGENKIASGENHTCAISGDKLYCWGDNSVGQVTGTAPSTNFAASASLLIPTPVAGLGTKVHAVFAGPHHTCAIVDVSDTQQAIAKCWGDKFQQAANGTPFYGLLESATQTIATSSSFTCAVPKPKADASSISCVSHSLIGESTVFAELPLNSSIPANTDTSKIQIGSSTQSICIYAGQEAPNITISGQSLDKPICITPNESAESTSILGADEEPTSSEGILSTSTFPMTTVNISINDQNQFRMVSDGLNFYGLLEGKALFWSIGTNTSAEPSALPEPIQGATSIHASNGNVCAVKDGIPICWGNNSGGQFDKPAEDVIPQNEPQHIPGVSRVSHLSLGGGHVCATEGNERYLRCWGLNKNGQLGINRTVSSGDDPMTIFTVVAP